MSSCEWDPKTDRAATDEHSCGNEATVSVGANGQWHVCDSCAELPEFRRYRKRVSIARRHACTTHHTACECREEVTRRLVEACEAAEKLISPAVSTLKWQRTNWHRKGNTEQEALAAEKLTQAEPVLLQLHDALADAKRLGVVGR